jgi:UDP-glucose 4-epimerase
MACYLVTGGAGFIGSHLVDHLAGAGHRIVVLDDLSTGRRSHLHPRAELQVGSILDAALVSAAMREADGCFHLAAIASVERCQNEVVASHRVNLEGGLIVMQAAARRAIPVVYASSAAVYGDQEADRLSEALPPRPISFYGADKLALELHARVFSREFGLPNFGLRFFNVYGPRQDPESPYSGVITRFADRLRNGQPLTVFGAGDQMRDFVAVSDIVSALMRALARADRAAHVANVGTGVGTRVIDLARLMAQRAGTNAAANAIQFAPPRAGDIGRSVADVTRLSEMLGFVPSCKLSDGLLKLNS